MVNERDISFENWTDDMFKVFCCLSGNDYVNNLKNIGIKTAYKLVSKYKTISSIIKALRVPGMPLSSMNANETKDYIRSLLNAINVYKHQTIFCPLTSRMMPLSPYDYLIDSNAISNLNDNTNYVPGARIGVLCQQGIASRIVSSDNDTNSDYLGPILEKRVAILIAKGTLNPKTMIPFDSKITPHVQTSHMDISVESRTDIQGIKRLKGLTAKRDLFAEFTGTNNNRQASSSSASSIASSLVIQTNLPLILTACKTPPTTTWLNNVNGNTHPNNNGSDIAWSFFDDDANAKGDDDIADKKKKKRKQKLNTNIFEFNTMSSKVGSSLQTLHRRNKKKFSENYIDAIDNDIDAIATNDTDDTDTDVFKGYNEYYWQTVEDWSKREDYDIDEINEGDYMSGGYDQYMQTTNNQNMNEYMNDDNDDGDDDDVRKSLNKKWLALGLTIDIDDNPNPYISTYNTSAISSHHQSSSMYTDMHFLPPTDDDDDVDSMDYWDTYLQV